MNYLSPTFRIVWGRRAKAAGVSIDSIYKFALTIWLSSWYCWNFRKEFSLNLLMMEQSRYEFRPRVNVSRRLLKRAVWGSFFTLHPIYGPHIFCFAAVSRNTSLGKSVSISHTPALARRPIPIRTSRCCDFARCPRFSIRPVLRGDIRRRPSGRRRREIAAMLRDGRNNGNNWCLFA